MIMMLPKIPGGRVIVQFQHIFGVKTTNRAFSLSGLRAVSGSFLCDLSLCDLSLCDIYHCSCQELVRLV